MRARAAVVVRCEVAALRWSAAAHAATGLARVRMVGSAATWRCTLQAAQSPCRPAARGVKGEPRISQRRTADGSVHRCGIGSSSAAIIHLSHCTRIAHLTGNQRQSLVNPTDYAAR